MTAETTATEAPAAGKPFPIMLWVHCLADLRRRYEAHMRWQRACAAYSAGTAEAPNVRTMPSKASKAHMYADAARLMSIMGDDGERPSSLAGIGELIERAQLLHVVAVASPAPGSALVGRGVTA
jgi:hypothetical protein